jgi:adenylate cyclase
VLAQDLGYEQNPEQGFEQMKLIAPTPILTRLAKMPRLGFVSITPDADGYLRRVQLMFPDGPALSLAAVESYLGEETAPEKLLTPAEMEGSQALINFSGPTQNMPTVSYYQALDPKTYLPPDFFKGKLVFVGMAVNAEANIYTATADHFLVPFSRYDGAYMPGVKVHANAALSLLRNRFIRHFSVRELSLIGAALGLISAFAFLSLPLLLSSLLFLLTAAVVSLGSFLLFVYENQDISPVYLLLPLVCSYSASPFLHYWTTFKQKAFIRKAFSTYLSPRLVAQLIEDPERLELGGEEVEGTVIFLDLAGFTSFSEKLKPRELIELINRNLGECAEIILKWDGMIDKYIGDCIMAVWGVPLPLEDHAVRACSAVQEIREQFRALSRKEFELTGVSLSVRIGLSSGRFVAGNVGGEKHFNYTVLGSEVNLASRLEGINKYYGTGVIVSESFVKRLNGKFLLREVDVIRVVGQQTPTKIYTMWGADGPTESERAVDELFQQGRVCYHARRFAEAQKLFAEALKQDAEDGPSKTFLPRCREYEESPPPADWDGVYQMRSK